MKKVYELKVKAACGLDSLKKRAGRALLNNKGDFVETLIKILISVVVGAAVLAAILLLVQWMFPEVKTKIEELFSGSNPVSGGS